MKIDEDRLLSYYIYLKKQRDRLMNNILHIRDVFVGFEWNDRIYDGLKSVLNDHIKTVNCLLAALDSALKHIDNYIDLISQYESTADM